MGLAAAGLIPTLDVALEALALALAGNVYLIAVGEYVSLNDLTDFVSRGIIQLEFAYIAVSGNAGLLQVTELRLGDELFPDGAKGYLHGFVAVFAGGLNLNHGAGARKHYGDGDHGSVFSEHLGHADLGAQNRFLHCKSTSVLTA